MSKADELKKGIMGNFNPARTLLAEASEERKTETREASQELKPKAAAVLEKPKTKEGRERKDVRINLVCYPSVKENLEEFVKKYEGLGVSANDLINRMIQKNFKEKTMKEILETYYLDNLE